MRAPLPPTGSELRRILDEAALPPIGAAERPTKAVADRTQVARRAAAKGLGLDFALAMVDRAGVLAPALASGRAAPRPRRVHYGGTSLSGVAPLLQPETEIVLDLARVTVDRTLEVRGRRLTIICAGTTLVAPPDPAPVPAWRPPELRAQGLVGAVRAAFLVDGAEDFVLRGCAFDGLQAAILRDTRGAALRDLAVRRSPGAGVILGPGNRDVAVLASEVTDGYGPGVMVMTGNRSILLQDLTIRGGTGTSNYHAGILVTDRRIYREIGTTDFLLADWHFPPVDPIQERSSPTEVFLVSNTITGMRSSGIYLDGAYGAVVRGNQIAGNSKEGICLDNGTTASAVVANEILGNGQRWGQDDHVLEREAVLRFGRMADGTPTAKVPGISLDNAIYNIVMANDVAGNYGSGIKLVRTAFFNLIGDNVIVDNNRGANDVHFFFGIELGGAVADAPADGPQELDFLPSQGNVVFGNTILGPHHAGIQFCPGCEDNDVFDNMIVRPERWGIEETRPDMANHFLNNFSLAPTRNARPNGPDGRVLIGGNIVHD